MTRSPFLLAAGLLCGAALLGAEEPTPAPTPKPCDPATSACLTVEKLALGIRAWSPGAATRDLAGGRLQAELRRGRWRVQGRLDGTATAGSYKADDWSTVRTLELHLAVVRDLVELPGGVTLGLMAAIGGAAALPEDGVQAEIARSVTAVLGVAGCWKGARIHVGVGAVAPFARGLAVGMTWQVPLSERTASVGYVGYGRRLVPGLEGGPAQSHADIVAWSGVGIRL